MRRYKVYSLSTFLMIPLGLLINYVFAQLVLIADIPIYLDSIGTVLSAALGGFMPGIAVGFLSNVVNGVSDPITMYYGIISIMIACITVIFSQHGIFRSLKKTLISVAAYSFIGGAIGSVLTWLLYGFNFGSGISAPFAIFLNGTAGLPKFWAQLSADMLLDIADKLLTVAIAYTVIHLIPEKLMQRLPLGFIYSKNDSGKNDGRTYSSKHSLSNEVAALIIITAIVVGIISTAVSYLIYVETTTEQYVSTGRSAVNLMQDTLGDINLKSPASSSEWQVKRYRLNSLCSNTVDIERLYIFFVSDTGMSIVYDSAETDNKFSAITAGDEIPEFISEYGSFIRGEEVEPIVYDRDGITTMAVCHTLSNPGRLSPYYAVAEIDISSGVADRYA